MRKLIKNSNILPFQRSSSGAMTEFEKLCHAENLVEQACQFDGKKRAKLVREALQISPNCVEAYMLLAEDEAGTEEAIPFLRDAVAAGTRALGADWKERYKGHGWGATETRSVMHAMLTLAHALQWEDELEEALTIYRDLMEINPNDNQGVRYLLASCLYEAECDDELKGLLKQFKEDPTASLHYTKALYSFRKHGDSKKSREALQKAYEINKFVPVFLSEAVQMPEESPSRIGFGDESEAVAYLEDNSYLWEDDATTWMADTLADQLREAIDDKELVEAVLKGLKGEWDN